MVATVITKTIGSAVGRDYASVALFEAAVPADLTVTNEQWIGELYNDSEFVTANGDVFSNHVSDSTRYVELKAAAGQSFRDHANILTNPLRYNAANGVGLRTTGGYVVVLGAYLKFFRLTGIQLKADVSWVFDNNSSSTGQTIKDCIFEGVLGQVAKLYSGAPLHEVHNCVFIGLGTSTRKITIGKNTNYRNCTFYSVSGTQPVIGGVYGTSTFENCLMLNCASFQGTGTRAHTVTNCVTDLASWQNAVVTSSILNAVAANEAVAATTSISTLDLRLKAGAQSIGAGKDLTAFYTDDIARQTRSLPFDVGAWEVLSSGTTLSPNDATHSLTSDNLTLTQVHNLSVNDATHSHTTDNVALTQVHNLTVQGASHSLISDNVNLTQAHSLSINAASHAVMSDQVLISQIHNLTVQNATHGLISDVGAIYNPAASTPNQDRVHKATGINRTVSVSVRDRTARPTNNRTLRI